MLKKTFRKALRIKWGKNDKKEIKFIENKRY